jgi:hypothetical protein
MDVVSHVPALFLSIQEVRMDNVKETWNSTTTAKRIGLPSGKALDVARHRQSIDLPFIRVGKRIRYDPETVEKWLKQKTVIPTVMTTRRRRRS